MIALLASAALGCEPMLPPDTPPEVADRVEARTAAGLQQAYRDAGYPAARAWFSKETCTLVADPGRVSDGFWFSGVSTFKRITLADNMDLVDGIVRSDAMDVDAARLQRRLGGDVTWRIVDGDQIEKNPLGKHVPNQRVEMVVEGRRNDGIGIGLGSVQPYGLITSIDFTQNIKRAGSLEVGVSVGTPYHRWITEAEPRVRWTYGSVYANWDGYNPIRPVGAFFFEVGNTNRPDLQLVQAYVARGRVSGGVEKVGRRGGSVGVGLAVEVADTRDPVLEPGSTTKIRTDAFGRVFLTGQATWFGAYPRRLDLRPTVRLTSELGLSTTPGLMVRSELRAQQSVRTGPLWWVARGRGLTRIGELRFYDQEPMGGDYLRVFFDHRYWSNHALQAEGLVRLPVGSKLGLGLYTDASVFVDAKTGDPKYLGAAGPNLHLLLWVFSIDVFYGIGLDGDQQLDQGASIDFTTVY